MLGDAIETLGQVEEAIEHQFLLAESAVKLVFDKYIDLFNNMDSQMRERSLDLTDIGLRILSPLVDHSVHTNFSSDSQFIFVGDELSKLVLMVQSFPGRIADPTDLVQL